MFGDGSNDVSMFLPEWTCVAMGNAIDELKARADFVTTDADKDGYPERMQTLRMGFLYAFHPARRL